jgi:hypothetical protein
MLAGRFASAQTHLEDVLELYDPISHSSLIRLAGEAPHVNSQALLGVVLCCLGYPNQAFARSRAAIAEARRLTHPPSLASSLSTGAVVLWLLGDSAVLGEWVDEWSRSRPSKVSPTGVRTARSIVGGSR